VYTVKCSQRGMFNCGLLHLLPVVGVNSGLHVEVQRPCISFGTYQKGTHFLICVSLRGRGAHFEELFAIFEVDLYEQTFAIPNLTFRGPCIVIYSYNKTKEMH
jgi:hypothetical protein